MASEVSVTPGLNLDLSTSCRPFKSSPQDLLRSILPIYSNNHHHSVAMTSRYYDPELALPGSLDLSENSSDTQPVPHASLQGSLAEFLTSLMGQRSSRSEVDVFMAQSRATEEGLPIPHPPSMTPHSDLSRVSTNTTRPSRVSLLLDACASYAESGSGVAAGPARPPDTDTDRITRVVIRHGQRPIIATSVLPGYVESLLRLDYTWANPQPDRFSQQRASQLNPFSRDGIHIAGLSARSERAIRSQLTDELRTAGGTVLVPANENSSPESEYHVQTVMGARQKELSGVRKPEEMTSLLATFLKDSNREERMCRASTIVIEDAIGTKEAGKVWDDWWEERSRKKLELAKEIFGLTLRLDMSRASFKILFSLQRGEVALTEAQIDELFNGGREGEAELVDSTQDAEAIGIELCRLQWRERLSEAIAEFALLTMLPNELDFWTPGRSGGRESGSGGQTR